MIQDHSLGTNWAGNYAYRAAKLHRPSTIEQVQEIVANAPGVRVLGSRHSFNDVADSSELVTLEAMPADVVVDHEASTVSVNAALKYGELAEMLNAEGVALHNLASLPHISVAGAVATATHGSGDANGNLAAAVAGVELVTSAGEIFEVSRGEPDFEGVVVGLGALGAVTRVTLDVEPAYEVRQRVFEGLSWDALLENFDEITSRGYSVSVFTRWGETNDQVWVKSRVTDEAEETEADLFGAVAAAVDRHPILELDASPCTPQLGRPGLWSDRLAHFRMGFTPSSGEELQSEYLLPRRHAVEAIEAVRALADGIRPILQVSELRTVAADRLWMSTAYGEDAVGIHFTWKPEPGAVEAMLVHIEDALLPLGARPHWGKVFNADAAAIAPHYERRADFVGLVERLDPRGAFRNSWLEAHVLGEP
ncbi:FAD-binding protein [Rubrobacter marinus]|uniref:FAD-binding protein n=1 Tax=Rubrobacter marinus TaxID=2653852 RepID=A0A6G8PX83_9ACTN|nr:D-arabinono-1,4-lactone oxidase [Rubrobacter marinus]QIN78747.1 FAD-binding protein [Rubrobacter marinus]